MSERREKSSGLWVVYMILGMTLNTIGIALRGIGWPRYLLMVAGLALLLAALTLALKDARRP